MQHQVPTGALVALAPGAADMKRLGAALAALLRPGDTVLLGGDLGAGKTTFTQGLAAALGVAGPVTSPTFVLLHSYRTSAGWDLLHADVWRLEQLQEVIDLAIPELLEEGAAAVVEWGELAAPALAPDYLHVAIDFEPGGPRRRSKRRGRRCRDGLSSPPWARAGWHGWPNCRRSSPSWARSMGGK